MSAFDSTFSYIPVVTLISETRDVTSGGRGKKCQPAITPLLIHPIYIGPTAYQSPQVGVTTATLGGRELKERSGQAPFLTNVFPESGHHGHRGSSPGELIACFLAAEKPSLPSRGCAGVPLRCAIPSPPPSAPTSFLKSLPHPTGGFV